MTNRYKRAGIIRAAVQIASFIVLPGLFVEALSGVGALVTAIATGTYPASLASQVVAAVVTIVATMLVGRVFCGWVCSFGAMGDLLGAIGRKAKIQVKVPDGADKGLKLVKYAVLALVVLCWLGIVSVSESWSPWEAFASLATWPPDFAGALTGYTVGLALLAAIMIASLFVERFFCRYLCPMGAIYSIFSHTRLLRIRKPRKTCGGRCRACSSVCPMAISLGRVDKVSSGECIDCMRCTAVCPHENAELGAVAPDAAPVVTAACAVSVLGLYAVGGVATNAFAQASQASTAITQTQSGEGTGLETVSDAAAPSDATTSTTTTSDTSTTSATTSDTSSTTSTTTTTATTATTASGYVDGTYTGSGTGHKNGTTTVSVTISNGAITDITTVSTQDDTPYYNRAFSTVVSEIIEAQSTSVSAVSGATHSSDGIMEAVANAIAQAKA